jgi:anti-sigma B factor antagonist
MTDVLVHRAEGSGAVVARLSGEITSATAPALYDSLEPLVAEKGRLVLEMTGVGYISSAGLRVLVLLHRRAEQVGAHVELRGLSGELRFVMAATGFLELFDVRSDPAAEPRREAEAA